MEPEYIFADPAQPVDEDARIRRLNDVMTVMGTAQGRRFVHGLIMAGGLYEPGLMTEYRMGERSFALAIRNEILELTPDEFRLMERENGQ